MCENFLKGLKTLFFSKIGKSLALSLKAKNFNHSLKKVLKKVLKGLKKIPRQLYF